ncbi:MAG: alpha/beta fold hydrolase [Chloroflexi bacterium]|nr:alpha/beta fold hydrolase [Chloroflexota bacterium]
MRSVAAGQFVDVLGLKTHYISAGKGGEPLVLIHGGSPGASAGLSWKNNIEALAEAGIDVYAFDQPGYGHTDIPSDHSSAFRLAHAKAFIDAMGFGSEYSVMGNSAGSDIAARIALADERVRRLVLVASGTLAPAGSAAAQALSKEHAERLGAYTPSLENARELSLGTLYHAELVTDAFVQERYEMSSGALYDAMLERRKQPRPEKIYDKLGGLKMETLIIWGRHDGGASVEKALLLFEAVPHAQLHVFSDSAHWVMWDEAARFNRLVADFVTGS